MWLSEVCPQCFSKSQQKQQTFVNVLIVQLSGSGPITEPSPGIYNRALLPNTSSFTKQKYWANKNQMERTGTGEPKKRWNTTKNYVKCQMWLFLTWLLWFVSFFNLFLGIDADMEDFWKRRLQESAMSEANSCHGHILWLLLLICFVIQLNYFVFVLLLCLLKGRLRNYKLWCLGQWRHLRALWKLCNSCLTQLKGT